MKISSQLLILSILFFLVSSCNDRKASENNVQKQASLQKGERIELKLTKEMSGRFSYIQYNDGLLYLEDMSNDTTVFVYDTLGNFVQNIRLYKTGPNGIHSYSGFFVQDIDSIYIVSSYKYKLFLMNRRGIKKKTYSLAENDKASAISSLPVAFSYSPVLLSGEHIFVGGIPDQPPYENDFSMNNLLIKLNLRNADFKYSLGYPETYKHSFAFGPATKVSYCINEDDEIIVSYPLDNQLYRMSDNSLEIMSAEKSSFIEVELPQKRPPDNGFEYNIEILQMDKYSALYYDKYNKLYYRVVQEGMEKQDAVQFMKSNVIAKLGKRYLMVYTKDFKLIGEFEIHNQSGESEMFIMEGGLFIKGKYPENEDNIYFQQYRVLSNS